MTVVAGQLAHSERPIERGRELRVVFYVLCHVATIDPDSDHVVNHLISLIWATVKVILGGTSAARDLQDLSALIGERDERTDTISVGDYGSRSLQRSTRRVPVMPPDTIRTLPFGTALVLLRSAPPLVTDLQPWTARPDSEQLRTDRAAVESALRRR